jgi:hypothetical protein
MARLATILRALIQAQTRDQKSILSLAGNNLFITSIFVMGPAAGVFIYIIFGLIILFPLSTDPMRKIPASRLSLWPLDRREHWILRALSPWVNPMTWAIAALAIWAAKGKASVGLLSLAAGLVVSGFVLSSLPIPRSGGLWRHVPKFPGPLNQLIRKDLRGMLSTLDVYCALLLSLSTIGFRLARLPIPREALLIITVLVVVALSNYAQSLFGLDGENGRVRYALLPLQGWRVLAAKDIAFLLVIVPLTLPLAPISGLAGALIALAIGHRNSVNIRRTGIRWRFSIGIFLMDGFQQVAGIAIATSLVFLYSPLFLIPCIAACAGSAWWAGRTFDLLLDN